MSKTKLAIKEILADVDTGRTPLWARKTEFIRQKNGSMRRLITRRDGTVEKDEIIPSGKWQITAARSSVGLSQAGFAKLLGVSVRTLQEWEQGRKRPSGAAKVLLKIAAENPKILRSAM